MKHAIFATRTFPLAILAATVLLVAAGASIAAPTQRTFVASSGLDPAIPGDYLHQTLQPVSPLPQF